MLTLKTFEEIKALALPPLILQALMSELLTPFAGDENALTEFWQESGSMMHVITDEDNADVIEQQEAITSLILIMAVDFPEYVLKFTADHDIYYLALTVINDEGAGCYLLIKSTHESVIPAKLQNHLL